MFGRRCCVLVGQMKTALLEIRGKFLHGLATVHHLTLLGSVEKYRPDRIIIECS